MAEKREVLELTTGPAEPGPVVRIDGAEFRLKTPEELSLKEQIVLQQATRTLAKGPDADPAAAASALQAAICAVLPSALDLLNKLRDAQKLKILAAWGEAFKPASGEAAPATPAAGAAA